MRNRRLRNRLAVESLESRAMLSADPSWLVTLGGAGLDESRSVVIGPGGDAYVTGLFNGTVDFDPGPAVLNRTASTGGDAFLARYAAADGSLVWVRTFGSAAGNRIAFDGQGNLAVGGTFSGSIDIDGDAVTDLTSIGGADMFLATFDANGALHWARRAGGASTETLDGLAVDGEGNWYLYGTVAYNSTADFGSYIVSTAGNGAGAMSRLDAAGNFNWVHEFTNVTNSTNFAGRIAVGNDGAVYMTGSASGSVGFGLDTSENPVTGSGGFVVKLTPDDRVGWLDSVGSAIRGVALDGDGNVAVVGYFGGVVDGGTVDLDPGPGQLLQSATGEGVYSPADILFSREDVFVLRLGADGNLLTGRTFGGTGRDIAYDVQFTPSGQMLVTGRFEHEMTLDGIHLIAPGNHVFVAALDSDLQAVWAERFGSKTGVVDGSFPRSASAIDMAGNVYTAGRFAKTVDFPTGQLVTVQAGLDGYLLKWNPALPTLHGRVFFDTNGDGADNDSNRAVGAGWVVYLDENDNGVRDADEPFRTTYDATGSYTFAQVAAGDYVVAVDLPPGWTQTAPTGDGRHRVTLVEGQTAPRLDFGVRLPTTTQTFVSTNVPKTKIGGSLDNVVASNLTVNLAVGRIVVDVDMRVRYTDSSTFVSRSEIALTNPQGTEVSLWSHQIGCSCAVLNVDTTFSDEPGIGTTQPWFAHSPMRVAAFDPNVSGQQFLADFDGQDPSGVWTLETYRYPTSGQGATLQSWSLVVKYATIPVVPQPPVISSLADSPDPVVAGSILTLTAGGVSDPDGTIASVAFYRDANDNGTLDVGTDVLVGTDTSSSGGWSVSAPTSGLAPGTYTYFARATDNDGLVSNVFSTSNQVIAAPPGSANDLYVWDVTAETRKKGNKDEARVAAVVRSDSNADGSASGSDAVVSGASVTLELRNTSGALIGTATGATNTSGQFVSGWFSNLAAGTYRAEVIALSKSGKTWNRNLDPTPNDTDLDGDNLPDQEFPVPGGTAAAASAVVVQVAAAGSPTAPARANAAAQSLSARRNQPASIATLPGTLPSHAVDHVMRLYARRSRLREDR